MVAHRPSPGPVRPGSLRQGIQDGRPGCQPMELELVIQANAPILTQKQEDGTGCCHVATTGWHHLPGELQSIMMALHVARAPEEKSSSLHKLFVGSFDSLFERFVPANLA